MELEKYLRKDLWKAIEAHYEREDYTECLRDALFHVCDLLREYSGLDDKDGTKLVESTLIGKNPTLHINKFETDTEKNIQQGIGFILKGLMQSVRNPISHEKCNFSQLDAEAIILHINYILNQIDHSGGVTKIDNVLDLLYDVDFTPTKEYAELLLKEIPKKKRYELILKLYTDKINLPRDVLQNFIDELYNSLTQAEKNALINTINRELLKCKDDDNLRIYSHYFMVLTYANLDKLVQLRIESLVLKSIKKGKMEFSTGEDFFKCNSEGALATWFDDKLDLLSNKKEIVNTLICKTVKSQECDYVFKYFRDNLYDADTDYTDQQASIIVLSLQEGDPVFITWMSQFMKDGYLEDEKMIRLFGESYEKGKAVLAKKKEKDELPF